MSATATIGSARSGRVNADALRVEKISKRFGGLNVFENISFEVPVGEIVGVIGPNGAGKTTLINVICGLFPPSSGRVLLGATEITGKPFDLVSRLGVVRSFQQTNTFRTATVEENLYRARRFCKLGGNDVLGLHALLDDFGLARHFADRSDRLPYGLQKMLGLIMALATRPRCLLLDEPAAGLERRERAQVDHFIAHARRLVGCGVLVVEHDMDLVRRLCPHVIVLEAGRLLAEGPPAEVLARQDVIDAYLGASGEE